MRPITIALAIAVSLTSIQAGAQQQQSISDQMTSNPVMGRLFTEMKTDFPDDFRGLVETYTKALQTGSRADAEAIGFQYARNVMISRLSDMASAPTPQLLALLGGQRDFIVELQKENPAYCAAFGMSGLPMGAHLSPRALSMINDLAVVQFRAERAGIDHPTERSAITPDDVQGLRQAMARGGASNDMITLIFANPGLQAASVKDQCDGSVVLYRGLGDLPPESGARVFSTILMATKGVMQKNS